MMNEIRSYVLNIAKYFEAQLGSLLVEAYAIGSLGHGGFSRAYSDIDVGLILNCPKPPEKMDSLISGAKGLHQVYGKKLSVFWGNPEYDWGRLRVLDRLDMLDHGVPLLHNHKANFQRPDKGAVRRALLESVEKSWKAQTIEFARASKIETQDRRRYIKCLLYPARLIYTWECLDINSNDRAVEYLRELKPAGLDLHPIEMVLECRHDRLTPEEIFSKNIDLQNQFDKTISHILKT